MGKVSISFLLLGFLVLGAECAAQEPLPDQASMDAPTDPTKIIVLPQYPTPGKKYLVERDGQQEIWIVKDQGTIEFVDISSQQMKLSIRLGPCFSFASLPNRHDFGRWGKPAFHTVPEDCKVWDGRTWTQTYAVQIPRLAQPCYYGAQRKAKVEGQPGDRLVKSDSSVDITGPGVRGGYVRREYQIIYSEKLQFFKELSPGYIGKVAIIVRELKE